MNDLHGRVHAGIGAAGGRHVDGMIGDARERRFDDGLHAARVRLRLPAGKGAAVVLEAECDARHETSELADRD